MISLNLRGSLELYCVIQCAFACVFSLTDSGVLIFFKGSDFSSNQNQKKGISILRTMQKEKWEIEIYFQPLLVLICGEFETLTNEVQVLLSKTNKSVKLKYLKVTLLLFALTLITMVMMMPTMMRVIFWEQFLSPPMSPHPPPQRIAK